MVNYFYNFFIFRKNDIWMFTATLLQGRWFESNLSASLVAQQERA